MFSSSSSDKNGSSNATATQVAKQTTGNPSRHFGGGKFANGAVTGAFAYTFGNIGRNGSKSSIDYDALAAAGTDGTFSVGSNALAVNDGFQQCRIGCLADNYGQLYETAGYLNPLSVIGGATHVATGQLEKHLKTQSTRNSFGSRSFKTVDKLFSTGQRQLRTLSQFRNFNAAGLVIGVGALGFQGGANAYCAVECLGSSGAAQ